MSAGAVTRASRGAVMAAIETTREAAAEWTVTALTDVAGTASAGAQHGWTTGGPSDSGAGQHGIAGSAGATARHGAAHGATSAATIANAMSRLRTMTSSTVSNFMPASGAGNPAAHQLNAMPPGATHVALPETRQRISAARDRRQGTIRHAIRYRSNALCT